jgi:tetratricopeptide (TPR) repeat protein
LLFVVLVCGWAVVAHSQSKKLWQIYAEAGETAFNESRHSTAEVMLLNAIKEAESDSVQDPSLVERLAMILLAQNRFDEAEAVYKRLLAMGEAAQSYPKTLADDAHKQATESTGVKAERLLKGEIALRQKQPASALLANAFSELANVHFRERRYDEAETEKRQSIQIAKDAIGQNVILDWAVADLALIQYGQGKGGQAESLFQDALNEMKQRRDQSKGDKDRKAISFKIADRLERLAELYSSEAKNEKSAPCYKEALQILESELGQHDTWTIAMGKEYIKVLRTLKRDAEAREVAARLEQAPK